MIRLVRVVLVALLIGPQAAKVLLPPFASCEERRDCCAPDGACDASCVTCPCCASPAPSVLSTFSAGPVNVPAGFARATPDATVLPVLPTEILHVPKSL
jgi:hypothetical protein